MEVARFRCAPRGQYFDKETNLAYNYFRDFDPDLGRYVQSDPIGLRGGINPYVYVRSNPLSLTDRLGLQATSGSGGQSNQNCQGPDCDQSYFDCFVNCIRANDPSDDFGKVVLTAVGGTFPKSWLGLPQWLGGASPVTTVPSAAAHAAGNYFRDFDLGLGRYARDREYRVTALLCEVMRRRLIRSNECE